MIFNEFQTRIRDYADYPRELGPFYVIMDMMKNVGVISDNLKKSILNEGNLSEAAINHLKRNLGLLLNNIGNMCSDIGINFEDVVQDNLYYLELLRNNKNNKG